MIKIASGIKVANYQFGNRADLQRFLTDMKNRSGKRDPNNPNKIMFDKPMTINFPSAQAKQRFMSNGRPTK